MLERLGVHARVLEHLVAHGRVHAALRYAAARCVPFPTGPFMRHLSRAALGSSGGGGGMNATAGSTSLGALDAPRTSTGGEAAVWGGAGPATAGARVAMNMIGPKLAHQQQWNVDTSGAYSQINLKAFPNLCLTVLPGCPHAEYGCMTVDVCSGSNNQLFSFKSECA